MQAAIPSVPAGLTPDERALLRGRLVSWSEGQSLAGWYPVAITEQPDTLWWSFLGDRPLTEAFFQDSLLAQHPRERRVCQTPLSALDQFGASAPPTAFVFHVSRCGSTLLTQMLATLPGCVAISEPPAMDAFLRLHHRRPRLADAGQRLMQLVAALGQRRKGPEDPLVVKLDSWHTPWLPFLRNVFPDTLMLFLYRDPHEVLASHRRQRGPQMVPGLLDTSLLQIERAGLAPADVDGYAARVLDAIYRQALASASREHLVLVNYRQLPEVLWTELLPRMGVYCNAVEERAMKMRARFHSKNTAQVFHGDTENDSGRSHAQMEGTAWCYEQLEALRLTQGLQPSPAGLVP